MEFAGGKATIFFLKGDKAQFFFLAATELGLQKKRAAWTGVSQAEIGVGGTGERHGEITARISVPGHIDTPPANLLEKSKPLPREKQYSTLWDTVHPNLWNLTQPTL